MRRHGLQITVDLTALRRQLGDDYQVADAAARDKCSKCRVKWLNISICLALLHIGGMR